MRKRRMPAEDGMTLAEMKIPGAKVPENKTLEEKKTGAGKRIMHVAASAAMYVLAAAVAALLLLHACGIRHYVVLSGSMEPALHTGSLCFVNTHADYTDVEEGDVITFDLTGADGKSITVTHRAVSITEEGIETKGDANDVSDGISVTGENFVGRTLWSVPGLGYVFMYLSGIKAKIMLLTVAAALIVLSVFTGKGEDGV